MGGVVALTAGWSARRVHAATKTVAALCNGCGAAKPWLGLLLYRPHDIDTVWGSSRLMKTPATASASFSIRQWT